MKIKLFKSAKESILAYIFSFLFLLINISTNKMQKSPHLTNKEVFVYFIISLAVSFIFAEGILWIKYLFEKRRVNKSEVSFTDEKSDWLYYLLTAAFIFALWIPVWLAFYPGIFAYDVISQIQQVKTAEYTTHHPLLHTLGLGFFYEILGGKVLKNYTYAIAAASLFQMAVFSLQLSYVHLFFKKLRTSKILRLFMIAFTALCPFFSVLSISMTKDVIFAGFMGMLLASVFYFEIDMDYALNRGYVKICFFISLIGSELFRSNGRYAVWVLIVFLTIKCIRQKKKALLILSFASLLVSELVGFGLKKALNASGASPTEMLSIPIQQIAFVYEVNYENLSPEERSDVETVIPQVINYNRIISDPIKFTTDYEDNKALFWSIYVKFFKSHPRQYIEAFLQTNLGFVCISDKTNATVYGSGYDRRRGFLMTYTRDGYGIDAVSKLPWLEDLYLKLYCQNDYQNNILTFLPCSMGLYFWLIVLSAFFMLMRKSQCFCGFALVLSLGATTLLGPCAIIRYMLPYVVCLPLLWAGATKGKTSAIL